MRIADAQHIAELQFLADDLLPVHQGTPRPFHVRDDDAIAFDLQFTMNAGDIQVVQDNVGVLGTLADGGAADDVEWVGSTLIGPVDDDEPFD